MQVGILGEQGRPVGPQKHHADCLGPVLGVHPQGLAGQGPALYLTHGQTTI